MLDQVANAKAAVANSMLLVRAVLNPTGNSWQMQEKWKSWNLDHRGRGWTPTGTTSEENGLTLLWRVGQGRSKQVEEHKQREAAAGRKIKPIDTRLSDTTKDKEAKPQMRKQVVRTGNQA